MRKKDPLKIIGTILIILGVIILLTAFPLVQQAAVSFGPVKAEGISAISATRILIGIVMIILGLIVYYGKEGLKIFMK